MKKFLLISIFFPLTWSFSQDFHLKEPNVDRLNLLVDVWDYTYSNFYLYLKENYRALQEKDSIRYDPFYENICSFNQSFEPGIHYYTKACEEAKGRLERIYFPKIRAEELKIFIERMYDNEENVWTTPFTFEPDGPGCYFSIQQTDQFTVLEIYCGC